MTSNPSFSPSLSVLEFAGSVPISLLLVWQSIIIWISIYIGGAIEGAKYGVTNTYSKVAMIIIRTAIKGKALLEAKALPLES